MPPEIRQKLSIANQQYVNQGYKEAENTWREIIQEDPNVHEAWYALANLKEELGELEDSFDLYLIGAHVIGKDDVVWKKLAEISE